MSTADSGQRSLAIEWEVPDHTETIFSNNVIVQHTDQEFILSFFVTFPPIILGDTRKLESLDSIKAKCVSRIVLTPEKMKSLIQAMQINYQKYEESHA